MRRDYRYGENDPFQWPQVFTREYDFLCAVRRPTPRYGSIWWAPDLLEDFHTVQGSAFTCLGRLEPSSFKPLDELVTQMVTLVQEHVALKLPGRFYASLNCLCTSMTQARDRVRYFPCTFRDMCLQVREIQRGWLMCRAWIDFSLLMGADNPAQTTRTAYMGAFTSEPSVVQNLSRASIPVWFIRPDISVDRATLEQVMVSTQQPDRLERRPWQSNAPIVFSGLSGCAHLAAICRSKHMYLDVSQSPLLVRHDYRTQPDAAGSSQVGPMRTTNASSKRDRTSQVKAKGALCVVNKRCSTC